MQSDAPLESGTQGVKITGAGGCVERDHTPRSNRKALDVRCATVTIVGSPSAMSEERPLRVNGAPGRQPEVGRGGAVRRLPGRLIEQAGVAQQQDGQPGSGLPDRQVRPGFGPIDSNRSELC